MEEIGIITKPQGLKGEFRVLPFNKNFFLSNKNNKIFINNEEKTILKCIDRNKFLVLKIEGINTCDDAESLRNSKIYSKIDRIEKLDDNEFYIEDVLNSQVLDKNKNNIGKLEKIYQHGAADVFVINNNGKEIMFPFTQKILISFDSKNKILIIDENILKETGVYED